MKEIEGNPNGKIYCAQYWHLLLLLKCEKKQNWKEYFFHFLKRKVILTCRTAQSWSWHQEPSSPSPLCDLDLVQVTWPYRWQWRCWGHRQDNHEDWGLREAGQPLSPDISPLGDVQKLVLLSPISTQATMVAKTLILCFFFLYYWPWFFTIFT